MGVDDRITRSKAETRALPNIPWERKVVSFCKALDEDTRYVELCRAGLDDDRIRRILDGQEDAPDTDDTSEADSQICKTFLAKISGTDKPEEDCIFGPVMRIDHRDILENVPEISDPSQLHGDVDLFQE